jgi:manganese/zinc/iron transport system substrate-binding protein
MLILRNIIRSIRWLLIVMSALLLLSGCGTPVIGADVTRLNIGDRPIRIVATTGHIADAVRHVGAERVDVTALMGPGVDPHLYKATARDVIAIQSADVVFYNGLELEGRMTEIFERLAQTRPVYAVSQSIPIERLRQSDQYENAHDPHIWFDPTIWSYAVDEVARRLTQLDPAYESLYESNAARYTREIAELDRYAQTQIERIPLQSRVLITAHDAFGYFGDHYGFEVHGLQGISTASEAGAADVQQLAQFIVQRNIRAIFVESSVPQATVRAVQEAVRARGGEVTIGGELFSDALGAEGTPEGAYLGMFRYNVDTIVAALTEF